MTWELTLPGCGTLKEKRSVIRSLKDRIRHRYNVSVAETDHHDVPTRAAVAVALVTTDRRFADSVLDKVDRFVEGHGGAVVTSVRRELL